MSFLNYVDRSEFDSNNLTEFEQRLYKLHANINGYELKLKLTIDRSEQRQPIDVVGRIQPARGSPKQARSVRDHRRWLEEGP